MKANIAALQKRFGKEAISRLGEMPKHDIDVISTGSLGLDRALGIGGVPKGRIVEIYGPESSGKTTLALHMVADVHRKGGEAYFVDMEHAMDHSYAAAIGVDIDKLLFSQPENGEQAMNLVIDAVSRGGLDLVVVDSVAALVPQKEIEGDVGDASVGLHARLMSQTMRKLSPLTGPNNTCVVFLNQLREKVGVMFGSPEVTTGGRALPFYASMRMDIRRRGQHVKGKDNENLGTHVKVKVTKNKLAPPFKIAEFDIIFGTGISRSGEVLDAAADLDIIQKSGSWYSYNEAKIGQGRDASSKFLEDNPELMQEIEDRIKTSLWSSQ